MCQHISKPLRSDRACTVMHAQTTSSTVTEALATILHVQSLSLETRSINNAWKHHSQNFEKEVLVDNLYSSDKYKFLLTCLGLIHQLFPPSKHVKNYYPINKYSLPQASCISHVKLLKNMPGSEKVTHWLLLLWCRGEGHLHSILHYSFC